MTVNTTRTRELDIDTIVVRALQYAGLLSSEQSVSSVTAGMGAMARDFLEVIIDGLQADGAIARAVTFYGLAVTSGTASYALPSETLDVVGNAMWLSASADAQTACLPMSREDYQAIGDKTVSGVPTRFYLDRSATMTLYLWPVPDENGTMTLQQNRLFADCNDGTKTLDLERHWARGIMLALASDLALASSLPEGRVGMLRGQAQAEMQKARAFSLPSQNIHMRLDHPTAWRR